MANGNRRRLGEWLPREEHRIAAFREAFAQRAFTRARSATMNSAVEEFKAFVHGDPVVRMDFSRAIQQAREAGFKLGYADIDAFMTLLDAMLTYAPPFSESSLIHCPVNALLDWPMVMPAGYALFRDPAFNAHLKRVLNVWSGFLSGPYSRTHLNASPPEGWFSPEADQKIGLSQFLCDPDKPYWGYASWNHFFTREFKPEARPVAEPDNHKVIVSACEASPYGIHDNVRFQDSFWIKQQPYSLLEILTEKEAELAHRFVGGTVYQAFLSAFFYHRWHAPVSGTIAKAYLVDGSYYSDAEAEGEEPSSLNDSQGYITAVAARAVIVIDCDDPAIGEVACVFVGMAEVSSCVIEALPGQTVAKGDELGYFQYGGSTYCLIFRPGVVERFGRQPPFHDDEPPVHVNAHLCTAR
ncbi:phosphatidylserine decarboxylase family protein [Caballeronia sp. LZ034LL]|uniref:phosphatidylserine decarboxylase family protein n=1 Tax=Caballeronia sp. LZ034LL TaxID=3038567 RepID=UPI002866D5BC|nr:phosphatidylserine decarboxylase family protein [Caballeronia sp. LZ034LL]MDR5837494.1 phosphatidylserine decarboxylase family protein [Caballeronia sp. LZ034LL]